MPVVAISPDQLETRSGEAKQPVVTGDNFATLLGAANAPVSTAVAINSKAGSNTAAVTSMAISGVASTASSGSGAYLATAGSPIVSGGYNYGNVGVGIPGTIPGSNYANTASSGVPGSGTLDQQAALFQQIQDANWQMLVSQTVINNMSRDYQAQSNMLKTKSDSELNAVRNMRA